MIDLEAIEELWKTGGTGLVNNVNLAIRLANHVPTLIQEVRMFWAENEMLNQMLADKQERGPECLTT